MAKISGKFLEFKGSASFNRIPITSNHGHWYVMTGKNSVTKVSIICNQFIFLIISKLLLVCYCKF